VKHLLELEVSLYSQKVGTLLLFENRIYFEYERGFLNNALEISPLKLPKHKVDIPYTNKEHFELYGGMAGVFFDSLPDKHGMSFIYRYFEQQGLKHKDVTLLHKLSFIGDRGLGAIEYKPKEQTYTNFEELIYSIQALHENMKQVLTPNTQEHYSIEMLMSIINSASPVGGARPKMLISYNPKDRAIKYNNEHLEQDYKRSIIKFDECYPDANMIERSINLTKLEYIYMSLAKECGINTATIHLHKEKNEHHLIIERFDRDADDNKIHICSAAGLMHKDISVEHALSYEELFAFTNRVSHKQSDIIELFRRMVFNLLSSNVDDHAKNFEFMMDRDGEWSLTPAFDITYSKGLVSSHLTTLGGKSDGFKMDDILILAKNNLLKKTTAIDIVEKTYATLQKFSNMAKELDIDEDTISSVETDIEKNYKNLKA